MKKKTDNYMRKLLKALSAGRLDIKKGAINHIQIAHDPWCLFLKASGPCNCSPDIERVIEH